MTHVFVVDKTTFKYHLEYLFAGTGAKDKLSSFLNDSNINYNSTSERMLTGMIADISRIRVGDKIIFYLQATKNNQGMFFGVFKVKSNPFFDENDSKNYLKKLLNKGLSFRVEIEPYQVFSQGITEHDYLDSLSGKNHPSDLCWSLIYRKLKGNRGCTMITDFEYEDLYNKLNIKNNGHSLNGQYFSFDSNLCQIILATNYFQYKGRRNSLDILPRLKYKALNNYAFETHLQAYIIQNLSSNIQLANLLLIPNLKYWIGNEVSCGVGMQRIDIMINQETDTDVFIRIVELKDESPYLEIITNQIPWYIEWVSNYIIPKYNNKKIHIIPTIIASGNLSTTLYSSYQQFTYNISNAIIDPLQYIGFSITNAGISFTKYL